MKEAIQSYEAMHLSYDVVYDRKKPTDRVIGLAGNPNVGKSTLFNQLTGMNQHTGNWPGKTVENAQGRYTYNGHDYIVVDMPGTYSLLASSKEEEVARDFICFGGADLTVVVADATCLERNLNLVLQVLEITPDVVLCVNLMDEAEKKRIRVDLDTLSKLLHIPVIGISARQKKSVQLLCQTVDAALSSERDGACRDRVVITYDSEIEQAIACLASELDSYLDGYPDSRWLAVKLLDCDDAFYQTLKSYTSEKWPDDDTLTRRLKQIKAQLTRNGTQPERIRDSIVSALVAESERIYNCCVKTQPGYNERDRRLDAILTSKLTGIPIMVILLFLVFWLTITGANYPSDLLFSFLFWIEEKLLVLFSGAPDWVSGVFISGMYRTLAWVISVMLPPMAIFFPLFTLLEDSGFLPRIAFNMDRFFKRACAHGKQCLTMCMVESVAQMKDLHAKAETLWRLYARMPTQIS